MDHDQLLITQGFPSDSNCKLPYFSYLDETNLNKLNDSPLFLSILEDKLPL